MRTRNFYVAFLILVFLTGCKKPVENPELTDPIYSDFTSEADRLKKEIEAKYKEIENQKKEIESPLAIEGQKKLARENIFSLKNEIFKLSQKEQYFRYSAESRKIFIRKKSLEAFKSGNNWEPLDIKEDYLERKRLSQAPKTWARGVATVKEPVKPKKSGH